jgi:hypothetical protein
LNFSQTIKSPKTRDVVILFRRKKNAIEDIIN